MEGKTLSGNSLSKAKVEVVLVCEGLVLVGVIYSEE